MVTLEMHHNNLDKRKKTDTIMYSMNACSFIYKFSINVNANKDFFYYLNTLI